MKLTNKNLFTTLSLATITFFVFVVLVLPVVSFGDDNPPNPAPTGGKLINPLGTTGPQSITAFIEQVLRGVRTIMIPVVALAVIYCGFLFVAARGKPEAITKAKDALIYTLIGAAILLGAVAIAEMIVELLRNFE